MTSKTHRVFDQPKFADFDKMQRELVRLIVNRAVAIYSHFGRPRDRLEIEMDISATHARCPLQLEALLNADDANFMHDIGGIAQHINRDTGKLMHCFLPRFAQLS